MSFRTALARGRRAAERLMTDTVTVERQTGTGPLDEATGEEPPTFTQVYSGPAKLQQRGLPHVTQTGAGGSEAHVASTMLHLPADTTGVRVGDRVTVDASDNPGLVGRVLVVVGRPAKTHQTALRLEVEEQQQ